MEPNEGIATSHHRRSAGRDFSGPERQAGRTCIQDASLLNGADIVGELNKSIDSKKVKPGGTVKGTVTQDVLAHGKIIIPRGAKLFGHVTEVNTRSKEYRESRLGIVFDKAVGRDGKDIKFSAAPSRTTSGSSRNTGTRSSQYTLSKAVTELSVDYGRMSAGSRGVVGLPGLRLSREQGSQSVVTSTTQNVKLDSGTQIVIQIINPAQ